MHWRISVDRKWVNMRLFICFRLYKNVTNRWMCNVVMMVWVYNKARRSTWWVTLARASLPKRRAKRVPVEPEELLRSPRPLSLRISAIPSFLRAQEVSSGESHPGHILIPPYFTPLLLLKILPFYPLQISSMYLLSFNNQLQCALYSYVVLTTLQ